MPSTGCAQEKVLACQAVHNGRKLSTLGISRTTLHVQLTPPGLSAGWVSRLAERSRRRLHEPGGERGWALGGPGCAVRPSGEALGARPAGAAGRRPAGPAEPCGRQTQRPSGMRAFAGRALAGLSSIRACVRQTGDSSAGSAGLSTSLLPARPAQMMRPQGRRPLRTRTARLRGEPRAGRDRTTLTSPGWPRSGEWSLTPIPNSRNVCPVTYPQPNNRL
jgi:hypothetical protein